LYNDEIPYESIQIPFSDHDDDSDTANEPAYINDYESQCAPRKSLRMKQSPDYYGEWVNVMCSEPSDYDEAVGSADFKKWNDAMKKEMESLTENEVWNLVKLPYGKKAINCKWVYKLKEDCNGKIYEYKARLVAQGYCQKYGTDYNEVFAPVIRFESIRTVVSMAVRQRLILHQVDVSSAFLNGELREELYMTQPEGFAVPGSEDLVCKLEKSIYGLKQSARCWNECIGNYLKQSYFVQAESDPCLYTTVSEGEQVIVAVYVDDIILCAKSIVKMNEIKKLLSNRFKVKDLGPLNYFLGVRVVQNTDGSIWIGQTAYCEKVIERFGMANCKPISSPADPNAKLEKATDSDELFEAPMYQSMVGCLIYLSSQTRPDISFAVNQVSRFCSRPTNTHYVAVKRILRYLKGTSDLGLVYVCSDDNSLVGYADADFAGDLNDRRSISGYVYLYANAAISWKCRKQGSVAISTAEAEYISLTSAVQECVWLKRLSSDIGVGLSDPIVIHEDNQAAIALSKNPQFHGRCKHIDVKMHFVREKVEDGSVTLIYCPTEDMVADILTKALPADRFCRLRAMLGMGKLVC